MMNNWEDLIQGHYRNQRQAMSNPAKWPQVDIRIWKTGSGIFESKSWYKYKGEDNPYNWLRYRVTGMAEDFVKTDIFNLMHNTDSCPFYWKWDKQTGWWSGTTLDDCIVRGHKMVSTVRFNGFDYRSQDFGYNLETNEQAWGKPKEEGEFQFVAINN